MATDTSDIDRTGDDCLHPYEFTARDYWIIALHLLLALGAPSLMWLGIILIVKAVMR